MSMKMILFGNASSYSNFQFEINTLTHFGWIVENDGKQEK